MPDNNGVQYTNPPQSRNEAIVEAIIEGTEYTDPPQSENEEILVSILNETPYEKPPTSRMADLLIKLKDFIEDGPGPTPPTPVRPVVPQTGTWQFKTTPTKGYIIIGKDDDPSDSAQFVRMVNGYGYPVVLNTTADWQDKTMSADTDNEYYPSGTESIFPNGCTAEELNKYIIAHPEKGEIAQHGAIKIWNSDKLTDTIMTGFFNTYSSGGGTKTKEELKEAIKDKYKTHDIAQGASIVESDRAYLEELLGGYIYTIGAWGGHINFEIDGITVGSSSNCESWTNYNNFSRTKNYLADGQYNGNWHAIDPYYIDRELEKVTESAIAEWLGYAYDNKLCYELFFHKWLISASKWADFKNAMDILKSWVDLGKIQVITRKQYYDLGEWVENPIVAVEITPSALYYEVGATITASDFTCKAILADGTKVNCESDKILDLSAVDTSTEGTFSVKLLYRGFNTSRTINVVSTVPTLTYLLENGEYSGQSLVRLGNYGDLSPSISFASGKTYKLEFDLSANTICDANNNYIGVRIGNFANNWATGDETQLSLRASIYSGHVEYTFTVSANKTISKLFNVNSINKAKINDWQVFNAYIYEVPT